jgi:hypothetical protein
LVAGVVVHEMPFETRRVALIRLATAGDETSPQVMRHAVDQLARRVSDIGSEQCIPRIAPVLARPCGRFERQRDGLRIGGRRAREARRIKAVGDVIDAGKRDAGFAQAVVDGVVGKLPG